VVVARDQMVSMSMRALCAAVVYVLVDGRVDQAAVVSLESRMCACIVEEVATTTSPRAAS
jgi:hypothetical protein